jgi:hypothetical protein
VETTSKVESGVSRQRLSFVHVPCWLCSGRGYVARDSRDAERDERCHVCNGKCTIVEEVRT